MDSRYEHPMVRQLWTARTQYEIWMQIEQHAAAAQARRGLIPAEAAEVIGRLTPDLLDNPAEFASIAQYEAQTRHDVAAFVKWMRHRVGEPHGRWIHHGLTSSDVVDTALAVRMERLWRGTAQAELLRPESPLRALMREHMRTPVVGYTHGQPAEPTTLGHRAGVWWDMVRRCRVRLFRAWDDLLVAKLSGPVGTYWHNPPEVEAEVADAFGLRPAGLWCSQIVPRDRLAAFASAAADYVAALGKVATDFRLMAHRFEVYEHRSDRQVGSSSMPHKRNPITAEQVCGMARLARGYALALSAVDLWEERDISHSCVERVALPDLLHVLLHSAEAATRLLGQARWDVAAMRSRLCTAGRSLYTSWRMLRAVEDGYTRDEAVQVAVGWADGGSDPQPPDPIDVIRNHPYEFRGRYYDAR